MSVIVVLEQRGGKWNRMSFEALEAGRKIGQASGLPVQAVVLGSGIDELAKEAAGYELAKVSAIDDALLAQLYARGIHSILRTADKRPSSQR